MDPGDVDPLQLAIPYVLATSGRSLSQHTSARLCLGFNARCHRHGASRRLTARAERDVQPSQ
eukprot:4883311-Prymnesium_polylepis.1